MQSLAEISQIATVHGPVQFSEENPQDFRTTFQEHRVITCSWDKDCNVWEWIFARNSSILKQRVYLSRCDTHLTGKMIRIQNSADGEDKQNRFLMRSQPKRKTVAAPCYDVNLLLIEDDHP